MIYALANIFKPLAYLQASETEFVNTPRIREVVVKKILNQSASRLYPRSIKHRRNLDIVDELQLGRIGLRNKKDVFILSFYRFIVTLQSPYLYTE